MGQRDIIQADTDAAQKIYSDMPNHAASEAEFLALVDEGLADIEAGGLVPFDAVAANLRRKIYAGRDSLRQEGRSRS